MGCGPRRQQPGLLPSPLPCFPWSPSFSRAPRGQVSNAPSLCLVKIPVEVTANLFCKASTCQVTCRQSTALELRPQDRAGHRPCPAGLGAWGPGVTVTIPNQSRHKGSTIQVLCCSSQRAGWGIRVPAAPEDPLGQGGKRKLSVPASQTWAAGSGS